MIMGRNKRTNFQDNGTDSEAESVPKKLKKGTPEPTAKSVKCSGSESMRVPESNMKKNRGQNIYTDTSSSSDSDNEKNSVKKSERSASNSESDSDSDSDSSGSDSSRGSKPEDIDEKPVKNSVTNLNPVPVAKSYQEPTAKSSGSDSYHSDTEEEDKKRRKKQKEMLKQQLNKKGKKSGFRMQENTVSKTNVKVDVEEEIKDDDEGGEMQNNEVLDWPESDILELIRRMEAQIPEGDTQKFDSRAARLDWDKIAFGNYSKQECHDTWDQISKRIRRFRKLSEVLEDAKEWAKKPWTNFYRGSKKNRHPDMPSKPLSAYMIYYMEQKDKAIQDNKGADLMKISKIITEKYKNLSDKEREKYSQKAANDKRDFDEKLAEFYREHPECEPSTQSKGNSKESTKGPRKPHPPFKIYFLEELKKVNIDGVADKKSAEEVAREKWRSFGDKKKADYIKMSLEDLKRYEREVKAYKQKHPDYTTPNYNKKLLNKEERLILERLSGKPLKPPNSAYSLFSRNMLQSNMEVKSKAPKLRMAEISKKWKELTSAEKHKFEEKVKELQEDYKLKLQKYLKSLSPEDREREMNTVKNEKKKKKEKSGSDKTKNIRSNVKKGKKVTNGPFYENEPKAPPLSVYEFFVEKFLAEKSSGMSKEARLKQAQECWEKLPEDKKEALRDEHVVMRQKYINEYNAFLETLSKSQLRELTARKAKMENVGLQMQRVNGTLSDSNDESDDENDSSSDGSDSEDSDSVKSKKNESESGRSKSSSSEDSDG